MAADLGPGQVYMAGRGASGQLGLGNERITNPIPYMVTELEELNIVRVRCASNFTCFITASGKVPPCPGANDFPTTFPFNLGAQ